MRTAALMACLAVVAGTVGLGAQEVTGSLQGRIRNAAGQPQAGVMVRVSGPDLMGWKTTETNIRGGFEVTGLPPGEYTVALRKVGVRPVEVRHVVVALGRTSSLGVITMGGATVELEPVVVIADPVSLDPVHTNVGATLDSRDYEGLPADRDYRSLMTILPHVTTSGRGDPANVAGSTGLENQYFIDGVNVTSPFNASSGTALPYNFVRAVEVKEGGYEAQYGKALGAVVNAVTYSGTDTFEGSAFTFVSPGGLSAASKVLPTLERAGAVDYDLGIRLGGPIHRGRLWYSVAYNPRVSRVSTTIPGLGDFADRETTQLFAGKATWQPSPAAPLIELSLFGDPSVHHRVAVPSPSAGTAGNADPFLGRLTGGGITGALRVTMPVRAHLRLEGRIAHSAQRLYDSPESQGALLQPLYVDPVVTDSVSGGFGNDKRRDLSRWTVGAKLTWTAGTHLVIAGMEYEDNAARDAVVNNDITRYDTASYDWFQRQFAGRVHNRVPTLYLQDSWRVTPQLAISPGLRWSAQTFIGAMKETAQRFPNEWQPRLGISWMPTSSGRQRIFASYGRFYQQLPDYIAVLLYITNVGIDRFYASDPRSPASLPLDSAVYALRESDYAHSIPHLAAENIDEYTVGYERTIGSRTLLTVRGIRRHLRSSFGYGVIPPDTILVGTPGKGDLAVLPSPRRDYAGLEVSVAGYMTHLRFRASYVLSRTKGNYPGLFDADYGGTVGAAPNASGALQVPYQAVNSDGLLPNDRTHVFKVTAVYETAFGLSTGAFITLASGTPVSERGADPSAPYFSTLAPRFLVPRGSAGRTPSVWDLNARLSYRVPHTMGDPRFVLDLLHVGNPQRPVWLDEQHFFSTDTSGAQTAPNAHYLQPLAYQPPMAVRLGMEIEF